MSLKPSSRIGLSRGLLRCIQQTVVSRIHERLKYALRIGVHCNRVSARHSYHLFLLTRLPLRVHTRCMVLGLLAFARLLLRAIPITSFRR